MATTTSSTSSAPIGSISGLASGIQWQDMVDQIISLDKSRLLDPLTAQQTQEQAQLTAWQNYKTVVGGLQTAVSTLADGSAFDKFSVTGGVSASGRTLLTATGTAGATPGTYKVEVDDVARAEKLGSNSVADVNAAMALSGSFLVGGKSVTISATDSLSAIRDKINAANTGSNASHVSASILSVSSGVNRLVLSSDVGGSAGIELTENGGSSVLSSLGLVSSSLVANTIDGSVRGFGFSSSTNSIGQTLGATMPAAGSFKVNGNRVDVDLSQDSLSTIASKINSAAGANTAIVSSEVVNGSTVSRLIVNGTVTVNPDDGAAAQAVSTQNLQQLGFLTNDHSASQLIQPTDAQVRIDGVLIKRSTNTISDAMSGVTLNLQSAEQGTTVDVTVARDTSSAVKAVQDYATAFNSVAAFVDTNTAANGPLAYNSAIRTSLQNLKNIVFNTVTGLSGSFTRGTLVGVSLDSTGKMQVDTDALNSALASNPNDVRALFATAGTSSTNTIQYMAAGTKTQPGSYAVNITQAATTPTATSSPIVGAYNNTSVADEMDVTDSFSGRSISVALADGDTVQSIAQKLNSAFATSSIRLTASVNPDNSLQIKSSVFGAASTFTVGFKRLQLPAVEQFGFSSVPYAGSDVQGTINGKAATGAGQLLTANAPATGDANDAQGLSVLYTGSDPSSGTVSYVLGIGGMMSAAATTLSQANSGVIDSQTAILQQDIDDLTQRQNDVQQRLDDRKATLTAQFTAMETALSKLQAQASALTSQLTALQPKQQ